MIESSFLKDKRSDPVVKGARGHHKALMQVTLNVLTLIDDYTVGKVGSREMFLEPILYGYIVACQGQVARQHHIRIAGSSRPRRVDFRIRKSCRGY